MSNTNLIDGCLRAHNDYRKRHNVPPLTHSAELSAGAQKWADHLAENDLFEHSKNRKYKGDDSLGENIAMSWSSDSSFVFKGKTTVL